MKTKVYYSDEKIQFQKQKPIKFEHNPNAEWKALNIHSDLQFQKISGFGGAFTDSAAITYNKMSDKSKQKFLDLLFSKDKGLGYNFCRSTINSCDFSEKMYDYVDEHDESLKSFDISHDKENIIPLIKDAIKKTGDMFLFSSPWSPSAWMKDSGDMLNGGKLKPEMYSVWANYIVKYIEEYEKNGIKINGLTVQNEPMATQTWESCIYTIEEQIIFARDYLKPALDKAGLSDVKIMVWDHNKEHGYEVAREIERIEGAKDCIYGIAFHWYSGIHFDELKFAHETSPGLFLATSEFCTGGAKPNNPNPMWCNGIRYAYDIGGNFNSFVNASCDWNLLLDENGGPYHARSNGCQAVVHYNTKTDEIILMPQYYAVKHYSSFIKNGAIRLGTSSFSKDIIISAFLNPDGKIVAVITSDAEKVQNAILRLDDYASKFEIQPKSITTVIIEK